MDYLSTFLAGVVFGLAISVVLTTYSKKGGYSLIKEDFQKIKERIEEEIH